MTVGKAKPETLSRPTAWPAGLAFGLGASFFGAVTSSVILIGGVVLSILSLIGWVWEACLESQ